MPGFLSSAVLNAIVVRTAKDRTGSVIEALVFSFLIYAILAPFGRSPVELEVTGAGVYRPTVAPEFLLHAMALAVGLALVLGYSITNDTHMKVLRKLGITASTARINTWLDILIDQRRYVVVTFTDGRRLFGWPEYYSNDTTEGLLYVSDPAWIEDDGNYSDLGVPRYSHHQQGQDGIHHVHPRHIEECEVSNRRTVQCQPVTPTRSPSPTRVWRLGRLRKRVWRGAVTILPRFRMWNGPDYPFHRLVNRPQTPGVQARRGESRLPVAISWSADEDNNRAYGSRAIRGGVHP